MLDHQTIKEVMGLNGQNGVCMCEVAQSCPTLCDPMDCSLSGSSLHGILQARVLEWVAISFSNMLSRLVITFLPRSECLLISWLQSPSAVILEPRKIKSDTVSPSISHEVMGPDAMILVPECWALSQLFHSPLSLSSRGFLVPLHFCHKGGVICISKSPLILHLRGSFLYVSTISFMHYT